MPVSPIASAAREREFQCSLHTASRSTGVRVSQLTRYSYTLVLLAVVQRVCDVLFVLSCLFRVLERILLVSSTSLMLCSNSPDSLDLHGKRKKRNTKERSNKTPCIRPLLHYVTVHQAMQSTLTAQRCTVITRANLLSDTVVCTNAAHDNKGNTVSQFRGPTFIFADSIKSVFSFFSCPCGGSREKCDASRLRHNPCRR